MATAKKKTAAKKEAPTVSNVNSEDGLKRLRDTVYIESGNVGLDIALTDGKGIPLGANIMLFGLPGTGKTTLIGDFLKRILDRYKKAGIPLRVHYVDAESSRELLASTGVMEYVYDKEEYAPQQVIYHEHVNSFAYLEEVYDRVQDPKDNWGKEVRFIIIDSVTKLAADSQLDNDVNKADYGDNARARKKLYLKWLADIQALDITQFWVSQMSTKQNAGMFEDPKKPAVSDFDMHNMDVILKLTANKDTKNVDIKKIEYDTIQGKKEDIPKYILKLDPGQNKYSKNRYGQNLDMDIMLWRGHGVINAYAIRKTLEAHKFIHKVDDQNYSMCQELADYLGPEALEQVGIKNIDKFKRKPNLNALCSYNNKTLVEFLKNHNAYRMKIKGDEETGEDDGLFI